MNRLNFENHRYFKILLTVIVKPFSRESCSIFWLLNRSQICVREPKTIHQLYVAWSHLLLVAQVTIHQPLSAGKYMQSFFLLFINFSSYETVFLSFTMLQMQFNKDCVQNVNLRRGKKHYKYCSIYIIAIFLIFKKFRIGLNLLCVLSGKLAFVMILLLKLFS